MRKILLLALLAVVATMGISAAPASAANCTATSGAPFYNPSPSGNVWFLGTLSNCTGVDQVRFFRLGSGFDDATISQFVQLTNPPMEDVLTVTTTTGASRSNVITCWYFQAVHNLDTVFSYQIHNSVTHTWGGTNNKHSAFANFAC